MGVATCVAEEILGSTVGIVAVARRTRSVVIEIVGVGVRESVSVYLVPRSHLSVTEVLGVGTGTDVWWVLLEGSELQLGLTCKLTFSLANLF